MDEEMGDIEIGELDLASLEKACKNNDPQNIAPKQIEMLTNILHKAKASNKLGIITANPKDYKKSNKESKKRGQKIALQRIVKLGTFLVDLGKYS